MEIVLWCSLIKLLGETAGWLCYILCDSPGPPHRKNVLLTTDCFLILHSYFCIFELWFCRGEIDLTNMRSYFKFSFPLGKPDITFTYGTVLVKFVFKITAQGHKVVKLLKKHPSVRSVQKNSAWRRCCVGAPACFVFKIRLQTLVLGEDLQVKLWNSGCESKQESWYLMTLNLTHIFLTQKPDRHV